MAPTDPAEQPLAGEGTSGTADSPEQHTLSTSIIHCCLTVNSTTLYTYDDPYLAPKLNINYAELVSKNIGTINAVPEDRSDDYKLSTYMLTGGGNNGQSQAVNLVLYYDKKLMKNNDLITLVILCSDKMLKSFVYNLMDKLMYTYLSEYYESPGPTANVTTTTNFEYKIKMKELITKEQRKLVQMTGNYGATDAEINQVRDIMNDNINKMVDRGENLNSLVDKTQNLNNSSQSFRRRAVQVKRKFWWSNIKTVAIVVAIVVVVLYLLIGMECGLPFYQKCIHPSKPTQPHKGPKSSMAPSTTTTTTVNLTPQSQPLNTPTDATRLL